MGLQRQVGQRKAQVAQPDRHAPVVADADHSPSLQGRDADGHHARQRINLPPAVDVDRGMDAREPVGPAAANALHAAPEAREVNVLEEPAPRDIVFLRSRRRDSPADLLGGIVVLPDRQEAAGLSPAVAAPLRSAAPARRRNPDRSAVPAPRGAAPRRQKVRGFPSRTDTGMDARTHWRRLIHFSAHSRQRV